MSLIEFESRRRCWQIFLGLKPFNIQALWLPIIEPLFQNYQPTSQPLLIAIDSTHYKIVPSLELTRP